MNLGVAKVEEAVAESYVLVYVLRGENLEGELVSAFSEHTYILGMNLYEACGYFLIYSNLKLLNINYWYIKKGYKRTSKKTFGRHFLFCSM